MMINLVNWYHSHACLTLYKARIVQVHKVRLHPCPSPNLTSMCEGSEMRSHGWGSEEIVHCVKHTCIQYHGILLYHKKLNNQRCSGNKIIGSWKLNLVVSHLTGLNAE